MSAVSEGAVSGAATGMAGGPWGALIGAGVGAIGGFMKGKAEKKKAAEMKKSQARMRGLATPEHLMEVVNHLTPLMRNIVESGLGPQFKQAIDSNLASHGLTGTGAGEAMRTSAQAVPTLAANKMATEEAGNVVGRQLGAESTAAGLEPDPTTNPLMQALLGGARGYMAGGGTFGKSKAPATPTDMGQPGGRDPYSLYGRSGD